MKYLYALLVLAVTLAASEACKTTPTTPDSFYGAVVSCTEANTANPQAGAAVMACLTDVVTGNYAGCLQGLIAGGTWTVQEIACLVQAYATSTAQRLNASQATPTDKQGLANANAWLKQEHIQFR